MSLPPARLRYDAPAGFVGNPATPLSSVAAAFSITSTKEPRVRKLNILALLLIALFMAGCGQKDTPESLSKEILANFNKMAAIFEGVTDEASAKKAVPEIEKVRASMRDIGQRAKTVKVNAAGEQKLNEMMAKDGAAAMQRLMAARAKLEEKPELLAVLEPALQGMENDM
jgi:hypothetical protein